MNLYDVSKLKTENLMYPPAFVHSILIFLKIRIQLIPVPSNDELKNHLEINNMMWPCIRIYYFNVSYCSTCFERHIAHHLGFKNCNCSLWFYTRLWLLVSGWQPQTYVKPEAANTVFELLMMSNVSPETCWAIRNVEIINSNKWSHLVGYF